MKARWSGDADRDREGIIRNIWEDNPQAARRMDALFDAAVSRLVDVPLMGKQGAIPGMREFVVHPNYRLVYKVTETRSSFTR